MVTAFCGIAAPEKVRFATNFGKDQVRSERLALTGVSMRPFTPLPSAKASMSSAMEDMEKADPFPSSAAIRSFTSTLRCGPFSARPPVTADPDAFAGVMLTCGADNVTVSASRSTLPFASKVRPAISKDSLGRFMPSRPARLALTSSEGLVPFTCAENETGAGSPSARRPVLRFTSVTDTVRPLASSRNETPAPWIFTSEMRSFPALPCRSECGSTCFGSVALPARSSVFIRPSFARTRLAFNPATESASTSSVPDSRGMTLTATFAESSERNSFSLACSDKRTLPSSIPATGNSVSFGVPSIDSDLWCASFMSRSARCLTKAPSMTRTAATMASSATSTRPPAA